MSIRHFLTVFHQNVHLNISNNVAESKQPELNTAKTFISYRGHQIVHLDYERCIKTTVFKCSWGWRQKASETCRVLLKLLINILPSCITLVLYIY